MGKMYCIEYLKNGRLYTKTRKFCDMDGIAKYLLRKQAEVVLNITPIHRRIKSMSRTNYVVTLMDDIRCRRSNNWYHKQPNIDKGYII
jgi:hypothetical protein